jgi:hypothetical protein
MTPAAVALNTILVVIPALNEAATIGDMVRSLQTVGLFRICIVDNGSGDRNGAIARQAGAEGVVEPIQGMVSVALAFPAAGIFALGGYCILGYELYHARCIPAWVGIFTMVSVVLFGMGLSGFSPSLWHNLALGYLA